MNKYLKSILFSLLPSLVLGGGFYFLVSLLSGMERINETSSIWFYIGFVTFEVIFTIGDNGLNIFGRFLKYAAYECWLSPLCVIIYTVASMSQANDSIGAAGAAGAGFAGFLLIFVFGICGGLSGLVFYLLGSSIKCKTEKNQAANSTLKKSALVKYLGVLCLVLVVAAGFYTRFEGVAAHIDTSVSSKGYSLSPNELTILDILLKDDALMFSQGENSFLKQEIKIITSARQVAEVYSENQVAGDQKFNDKLLFLSGRVQGINSGIGNEPYLLLYGINLFFSPQVHFNKPNTEKIATLKRNQIVYLVCKGNGAVIGVPMFKDCEFASDYAEERISTMKIEIANFLKGENENFTLAHGVALFIAIARTLPETSPCFNSDEKSCISEIRSLYRNQEIVNKTKDVINELRSLGVNIKPLKENITTTKASS